MGRGERGQERGTWNLCHWKAEGISKAAPETEASCFVLCGECQAVIMLLTRAVAFFWKRVASEEGTLPEVTTTPPHTLSQSLYPPCSDPCQRGSLTPGLVGGVGEGKGRVEQLKFVCVGVGPQVLESQCPPS